MIHSGDSGHLGAGDANAGGGHALHAGPRKHFGENGAQIGVRHLNAHAQALDRAVFDKRENLFAIDDRSACARSTAVNSQHHTH